jgi:hypothetical protein
LQSFAQFCTHYTSSHISEICTAADNSPKIVVATFLLLTDLTSPARLAFRGSSGRSSSTTSTAAQLEGEAAAAWREGVGGSVL